MLLYLLPVTEGIGTCFVYLLCYANTVTCTKGVQLNRVPRHRQATLTRELLGEAAWHGPVLLSGRAFNTNASF